jgi:hypothetical protein
MDQTAVSGQFERYQTGHGAGQVLHNKDRVKVVAPQGCDGCDMTLMGLTGRVDCAA